MILSDEALDLAIETDNIRLIEKAYSLKGKVFKKKIDIESQKDI